MAARLNKSQQELAEKRARTILRVRPEIGNRELAGIVGVSTDKISEIRRGMK